VGGEGSTARSRCNAGRGAVESDTLMQVLAELPTGARLATETCYQCWKVRVDDPPPPSSWPYSPLFQTFLLPHQDMGLTGVRTQDGKFPTSELMSFLRSICKHSRSLHDVFNKVDGAAAPSGAEKGSGTEGGGGSSMGRSAGAQDRMERYSMEESSGPENEEDPTVTETDIEHLRLMRQEVQRRRYDSRKGTTSQKQAQFLKWCISGLASVLQPSGKARLAEYIHEYLWNATSPDAVKVCRPFALLTSSLPRQTPSLPWSFSMSPQSLPPPESLSMKGFS
jgi:hypothetical protein